MEFFGPVDGVMTDGYLHEEGDILLVELSMITRRNEEKTLVLSIGLDMAERLQGLLNERIKPRQSANTKDS